MAINLPIISKFDNSGIKSAEGAFAGLGKSLLGLGAIVAGAFSVKAIVDFAKESVLAAEGIEKARNRISTIADSMGIFGGQVNQVTDRLVAYADSQELLVGVESEVIQATQAKLLTFKELAGTADVAGGAFDRATQAAIDLAASGFGTAEGNAVQLGKALNDPIKGIAALTKSGITFTDAEKEKIRVMTESGDILGAQNMVLAAIEAQVGGVAAATANMSTVMALAFDSVKDSVGIALLPAFQEVGGAIVPLIQTYLPKITEWLDTYLAPAAMNAAEAISGLLGRLTEGESIGDIFASMFASIGEFFTNGGIQSALDSMVEMRQQFIQAILDALPGVIEGLVQLLPALVAFIVGDLIPTMIAQFVMLIDDLAALFAEMLPMLVEGFVTIVPQLIQSIADLLPLIVSAVLGMLPTLLKVAIDLFIALVDAVVEITPDLINTIVELLPEIVDSIVEMLPEVLDAAIELFTAIVDSLPIILPLLMKAILDLLPKILDSLISLLPALIDGAFQLFTGLITALIKMTPELLQSVLGLIPQIVSTIIGAIPQLVRAGFEIVRGFAKGIIENAPRILGEAIKSMGDILINGIKNFLGIASPSKVFIGIGGDVVAGLEKGLGEGEKLIAGAAVDLSHSLTVGSSQAMASAVPSMIPAPSVVPMQPAAGSNVINVTVNAGMGADGSRIGQKIVDEILKYERSSGRVFARA